MNPTSPPAPPQVLVPASEETAARIAPLLRSAGLAPIVAPLIASQPVGLDSGLERRLAAVGAADWLIFTSKAAVSALAGRIPTGSRRVAVVGERTAQALVAEGVEVALIGEHGAADLAERLVAATGWGEVAAAAGAGPGAVARPRVVVLGSAQSHHDLDARLRAAAVTVERIDLYRTVPVAAPAAARSAVQAGSVAAALVTSGTVAEQLLAQFGADLDRVALVSLGAQTTADAQQLGLRIAAQAQLPTLAALVETVVKSLRADA